VADMVNRLCDYKAQHTEIKRELGYYAFLFFVLFCFAVGEQIYMDGEERPRIRGLLMVEERKEERARQGGVLQRELEGIGAEQSLFVLISRRLEEAMISLFFM